MKYQTDNQPADVLDRVIAATDDVRGLIDLVAVAISLD
jgi:hypothetical protein